MKRTFKEISGTNTSLYLDYLPDELTNILFGNLNKTSLYLDYLPDELINILFDNLKNKSNIISKLSTRYNKLYNMRLNNIKNGNINPDDVFVADNGTDFGNGFVEIKNVINKREIHDCYNIDKYGVYINGKITKYNNWLSFVEDYNLDKIQKFYFSPTCNRRGYRCSCIYKDINDNYAYLVNELSLSGPRLYLYTDRKWKAIYDRLNKHDKLLLFHYQKYHDLIDPDDIFKFEFEDDVYKKRKYRLVFEIIVKGILLFLITYIIVGVYDRNVAGVYSISIMAIFYFYISLQTSERHYDF